MISRRPMRVVGLALLAVGCAAAACEQPTPTPTLEEPAGCRRSVAVGSAADTSAVEWRLPRDSTQVASLDAWCAAVGAAVVGGWGDRAAASSAIDTLWLVSWNVAVGGGDLDALLRDLRDGRLTGGVPVEQFVLLLQEAYRAGESLPKHDPDLPGGSPKDPDPPNGERRDIVRAARDLGLWVVYVPAMRNGRLEDRGNAILSTIPLRDPLAVELPVARQRRVVAAATIAGRTRDSREWRVRAATVHLESSPAGEGSGEDQRLAQVRGLLELLPVGPAVVAGDFNTRSGGVDEPLVPLMLAAFPDTPTLPAGHTYAKLFGIWREYLDYMFFRLPAGAEASYTRAPDRYGSDHHPLVGQVVF